MNASARRRFASQSLAMAVCASIVLQTGATTRWAHAQQRPTQGSPAQESLTQNPTVLRRSDPDSPARSPEVDESVPAATEEFRDQTNDLTPAVLLAVDRATAFLATQQKPDGSFEGGGPPVAMAGLALMAMLSAGHTPDDGIHGRSVSAALAYLLKNVPDDGYIGAVDDSRMYGQGIVTLALAEACGADPDPVRRQRTFEAVQRLTSLILKAQSMQKSPHYAGGWRYQPTSPDSDLSLSAWCALAIRAAEGVGVEIPPAAAVSAVAFVTGCRDDKSGGFAYQPGQPATASMTGVGIVSLTLLDRGDRPDVAAAGVLLLGKGIEPDAKFPYYTIYYTTYAAFVAGGGVWDRLWTDNRNRLLTTQSEDGGFPVSTDGQEPGRIYSTAMASLSLTIPFRHVPVYQR